MKRLHYTAKYLLNPTHPVTINVIGAGGTGSQVLTSLARIDQALFKLGHPGLHITTYDPDIVNESNIGRQLFSEVDIGLNKAVVLTTRLNRFFGISWESIAKIYSYNEESRANITITCVDNVKARIDLNHAFKYDDLREAQVHDSPIYWLDFGNTQYSGQVILGTLRPVDQPKIQNAQSVSELPTIAEMFDLINVKDEDSGPSCSLAEALSKQDLFINSALSQVGCALLWKLLSTGSIDYHGAFMNLQTMNVNPIKI